MYGINYDKIKLEASVKDMVCKDYKFFHFLMDEIFGFYDEEGQMKEKYKGKGYCRRYISPEHIRYEVSFKDNPNTNDLEIRFISGDFEEGVRNVN